MSLLSEDNFSMSAEKYLAKYHILTYLADSITQLLEHREENPKVVPAKFLCEYFCSLRDGNHTMFREFHYIRSTPHNRASFVVFFWKSFRQIGKKGDLLSIQEYHSLLGLLCPDFPFKLVQKIARIVLIDDALDCLISFSDFIYAFQVQFYYEEFLEKTCNIYQSLLQTLQSPRDPVIVPTSGENDTKIHQNIHLPADGVDALQFFRAIYPLLDRVDYSTPPLASLKEILFNVPRISFYEFLMAIAKSDSINAHIGRLPGKADLLEGTDTEMTSKLHKTHRQINRQKFRKTNEGSTPRPPQKAPGNISLNRPSSALWRQTSNENTSIVAAAAGAAMPLKRQHKHRQNQIRTGKPISAQKTLNTDDSDSSESASTTSDESSDTN